MRICSLHLPEGNEVPSSAVPESLVPEETPAVVVTSAERVDGKLTVPGPVCCKLEWKILRAFEHELRRQS